MKTIAFSISLAVVLAGCQQKRVETPLPLQTSSPAITSSPVVVEIYDEVITQEFIDEVKEGKEILSMYKDVPMDDYLSQFINGYLRIQVQEKEFEERNITPDDEYVQNRMDEGEIYMTDEEYAALKQIEILTNNLLNDYRASGKDIDAFIDDVWDEQVAELRKWEIAYSENYLKYSEEDYRDSLRTDILLLDSGSTGIGYKVGMLPETKEEFLSQVNAPSTATIATFEHLSQIKKLNTIIAGELTLTADEIARGRKYYNENKADLDYRELEHLNPEEDMESILLLLKRLNMADRWMSEKLRQDARFYDPAIEKAFYEWLDKNMPRHREVFGPFDKKNLAKKTYE